jgi:hypothetical protein
MDMQLVLAFVPLAMLVLLPSAALKLAAVISRIRIRWLHCFVFGGAVALASIMGQAATVYLWQPPLWLAIIGGAAIYMTLGTWFVSTRGMDRAGKPAGRAGGMKVMLVYLSLLAALIIATLVIAFLARPG